MRKSIIIALACCGTALFSACNKVIDGVGVNIGMQSSTVDFTIPVITSTNDTSFVAFNSHLDIDSIIRANSQFSANNIKSAKLESVTVSFENGDEVNNFGALQNYKVLFASNNKPDMITVAQNDNNPDDHSSEISLPVVTGQELKDYFKATEFSYIIQGRMRRATTKELNCHAVIKYKVKVGL
ncbi:MAG: hypothetical protein JSS82_03165 [Bacteroidetes bacterium]|nr:hypothetical protein [Bacteroidota bacterium]